MFFYSVIILFLAFTSIQCDHKKAPRRYNTLQKTKNSTKETVEPGTSNAKKQTKVKNPVKQSTVKKRGKPIPKSLSFSVDSNIQTDELTSQLNTNFNTLQPELVQPLQDCSNSLATSHLVGDYPTYSNFISKDSGRSSFREDTFRGTKSPDKVRKSHKVLNLSHKLSAVSAKIKANSIANVRVPTESLQVLTEDLEAPMTSAIRARRSSRLNSAVQESEFVNLLTDNKMVNLSKYMLLS